MKKKIWMGFAALAICGANLAFAPAAKADMQGTCSKNCGSGCTGSCTSCVPNPMSGGDHTECVSW